MVTIKTFMIVFFVQEKIFINLTMYQYQLYYSICFSLIKKAPRLFSLSIILMVYGIACWAMMINGRKYSHTHHSNFFWFTMLTHLYFFDIMSECWELWSQPIIEKSQAGKDSWLAQRVSVHALRWSLAALDLSLVRNG